MKRIKEKKTNSDKINRFAGGKNYEETLKIFLGVDQRTGKNEGRKKERKGPLG